MICKLQPCYGIAWGVVQQLAPGQSVTLTSTVSAIDGRYSSWKGFLQVEQLEWLFWRIAIMHLTRSER